MTVSARMSIPLRREAYHSRPACCQAKSVPRRDERLCPRSTRAFVGHAHALSSTAARARSRQRHVLFFAFEADRHLTEPQMNRHDLAQLRVEIVLQHHGPWV